MGVENMEIVKGLIARTKYYFDNTGIHGLRYITEPGRHLTERIFWSGVCSLAVFATYKLLVATWYNFQHNAVNFGVETSYLDWNTTFPSITVCEHEAPDKIFDTGSALYGDDRNMNLDFFVRDIAFFDGTCVSCSVHCGITINCTENFASLVKNVRAPCEELLGECMWNGAAFNCCLHFLPLHTEMGTCYSLNSMHTSPCLVVMFDSIKGVEKLPLISNRKTGPGKVEFAVYEATKLFIHSTEEVPTLNHPQEEKVILNWGVFLDMVIHVVEIENDPLLGEVSVEQRNCRFPEENNLRIYDHYSYSACVVDCRTAMGIKLCNCTHHFVPKFSDVGVCDVTGLACISNHAEILRSLKPKGSPKKGLECDCMSSCTEPEYTVISKNSAQNEKAEGTQVSVAMDALPAQRFKRNVVRTKLDLVVSMGGTAGLFLGASILSTAEWVYYMFIRKRRNSRQNDDDENEQSDVTTMVPNLRNSNLSIVTPQAQAKSDLPIRIMKHGGKQVFPFMR